MRRINTNNNWYSRVVLVAIGMIGALGQTAFLHNQLVHSYPYKMMHTPSAEFYSEIGECGYYIALVAATLGAVASLGLKRIFVAALPVFLGPLAYWIVFIFRHVVSDFTNEQMTVRNFEAATGYSNISDFTLASAVLLICGIAIAFLISFSLLKIEAVWTSGAETRV